MGLLDKVFGGAVGIPEVGAASALLGYFGTKQGASAQNYANAKMAENAMAFEERMSNTAYQRAMADMKAAGLNPMLAASKGGASTPSGQQARMENTQANALNSAIAASQIAVNKAQAEKTSAEANVIRETGLRSAEEQIKVLQRQQIDLIASAGLKNQQAFTALANESLLRAQYDKTRGEVEVVNATAENLRKTFELISQQTINEKKKFDLMVGQIKLVSAQAAEALARQGLADSQKLIADVDLRMKEIDKNILEAVTGESQRKYWSLENWKDITMHLLGIGRGR